MMRHSRPHWSTVYLVVLCMILAGCGSSATTPLQAGAAATTTQQTPTATSAPVAPPTVYFGGEITSNGGLSTMYALNSANGSVQWSKPLGLMYGLQTTAAGSAVYAADMLGTIIALNPANGNQLWKIKGHNAVDFRPVADDSALYVGSSGASATHGYVDAYSATDGARLWERDLGVLQAPQLAIAQGIVYMATQNTLTAMHATDGTTLWKISVPWAAPPPHIIGDAVYLNYGGDVRAYNAADGTLKWQYTPTSQAPGGMGGTVVAATDGLVFARNDTMLTALHATDGSFVWNAPLLRSFYDASAYDHVVYAIPGTHLVALAAQTGKQVWSVSLPGVYGSAPILNNGALFEDRFDTTSATPTGYVYALNPTDGSILWKFTHPGEAFTALTVM